MGAPPPVANKKSGDVSLSNEEEAFLDDALSEFGDDGENTPPGGLPAAMEGIEPSPGLSQEEAPAIGDEPVDPLQDDLSLQDAQEDKSGGTMDDLPEAPAPVANKAPQKEVSEKLARSLRDKPAKEEKAKKAPKKTPPKKTPPKKSAPKPVAASPRVASGGAVSEVMGMARAQLLEKVPELESARGAELDALADEANKQTQRILRKLQRGDSFPQDANVDDLGAALVSEIIGLGPLEAYLADEEVSSITVSALAVQVQRQGLSEDTGHAFTCEESVQGVVSRLLEEAGKTLHADALVVEASLPDGTRLHAMLPPVSRQGTTLLLELPRRAIFGLDELVQENFLSPAMAGFLETCALHRRNIVLTGDVGSGRTTLLNALGLLLPEELRVVSLEEVGELQLPHAQWFALEAAAPGWESEGISMEELILHALRLRPHHLLLGEIQGEEFMALWPRLIAGFDGVMMVMRAAASTSALERLASLCALSPSSAAVPHDVIHQELTQALNIVVQVNQFPCGTRKVTSISELTYGEGQLELVELFSFARSGVDSDGVVQGSFSATGQPASFFQDLEAIGFEVDYSLFRN